MNYLIISRTSIYTISPFPYHLFIFIFRPVGSLIRKDQRSDAPSESTKSLSTSSTRLETQKRLQEQMLGTKKPSSSQDDAYKKFMEELSGLI